MNAIDIQNAIAMLHNEGYKIIPPKQEEKPKEWQVTKIKGQTSGKIYTMNEKNIWVDCNNNGFAHDFNRDGSKGLDCDIVEVKRLSDGEVFTIGDTVYYDEDGDKNKKRIKWVIRELFIRNDGVMLARSSDCGNVETIDSNCYLKKEQPVSTDAFWTDELVKEYEEMFYHWEQGLPSKMEYFKQSKSNPKISDKYSNENAEIVRDILFNNSIAKEGMCNCCGGNLVYIRGKYPNTDKRSTCPTCTTERLEQISEIASSEYGKTCKNN